MVANLNDTVQAWEMDRDGHYRRVAASKEPFSVHAYCMANPSLSGRGSAFGRSQPDLDLQLTRPNGNSGLQSTFATVPGE